MVKENNSDLLYREIGKKQVRLQQAEELLHLIYDDNYEAMPDQWNGSPRQKEVKAFLGL